MSILPPIVFIAGAMMLFSISNVLPDAVAATHRQFRRLMMQGVVSLFVLAASLLVVLTHGFDQGAKYWAFGTVGMVVGYWLKSK